jgi:hypothetical protein
MAPPLGVVPTVIGVTVFVATSIIETVFEPLLITPTFVPSGLTASPTGWVPTLTVAITVLVAVLITETLLLAALAT